MRMHAQRVPRKGIVGRLHLSSRGDETRRKGPRAERLFREGRARFRDFGNLKNLGFRRTNGNMSLWRRGGGKNRRLKLA